jgi:DNA-binding MltR family transcriptional regulator
VAKKRVKQADDLGAELIASMDQEFRSSSDRVVAILGAAYLDSILEQLLLAVFDNSDDTAGELISGGRGVISSNGVRFRVAFCLGLLNADERDDLENIGKIRNQFAHYFSTKTFNDDDKVMACVDNLKHKAINKQLREKLAKSQADVDMRKLILSREPPRREAFIEAVRYYCIMLLPKVRDARRADSSMWFGDEIKSPPNLDE